MHLQQYDKNPPTTILLSIWNQKKPLGHADVFIDIPRKFPILPMPYVYQWLYTAMTRARKELYVVNDFWVM